jgi:hypothetical protein
MVNFNSAAQKDFAETEAVSTSVHSLAAVTGQDAGVSVCNAQGLGENL